MFRMWGKEWKDHHMLRDTTVCISDDRLSRTDMVLQALEEICYQFDLGKPIWLDANIREFQRLSRTRFGRDCFIETLSFDYLEIQVIEE